MTDPTAKQLLSEPITLHMEGSSSTKPQAADMDVTVALMGQNLAMGVLADGNKAWVEYENAWYAVPQENTKALESGDSGALPTEQLADLGPRPAGVERRVGAGGDRDRGRRRGLPPDRVAGREDRSPATS